MGSGCVRTVVNFYSQLFAVSSIWINLLANLYPAFFAVVLFPISLNVLLFHTILVPSGWLMGVTLMVPNLLLGYGYRKYYSGMFTMRPVV